MNDQKIEAGNAAQDQLRHDAERRVAGGRRHHGRLRELAQRHPALHPKLSEAPLRYGWPATRSIRPTRGSPSTTPVWSVDPAASVPRSKNVTGSEAVISTRSKKENARSVWPRS